MRLLNLWPDAPRSKRSSVMRLWQESIFALLLTGLLLAAAYVFLGGRVQQAREVIPYNRIWRNCKPPVQVWMITVNTLTGAANTQANSIGWLLCRN